jgi:RNA recognition motif-containing protein
MNKKLYVGGLPYKTTEQDLSELFSKAGEVVSARIITDRETRRSRGFGFVEMADDSSASSAIEMFNGKDFDGRNILVTEAKPDTNNRR